MSKFKSEIILKQVTPMIHFQYSDYGACLRASDVKPRLDKFIISKNPDIKSKHRDWFIDPNKNGALDYRMTISLGENPNVKYTKYRVDAINSEYKRNESQKNRNKSYDKSLTDDKKNEYLNKIQQQYPYKNGEINSPKSFFGNMVDGSGDDKCRKVIKQYKEGILVESDIKITIFTMKDELLKKLKENIADFFLINNFGTRSDKGLGSFYVQKIDENTKSIPNANAISSILGKPVYKIDYKKWKEQKKQLEDIRVIYALMKGGINYSSMTNCKDDYYKGYIYRYFFADGPYYNGSSSKVPRNDKAFMKRTFWKKELDENTDSEDRDKEEYDNANYLYVRAILGVPEYMEFKDKNRNGRIDIKAENKSIKRVPSPIVFKALPDAIYILPQNIDECLLSSEFIFSKNKKETIRLPEKFDLIDFLDNFMVDFNDKKNPKCGKYGLHEAKHKDFDRVKNLEIEKFDAQKTCEEVKA